jgi:hypothetical protein
MFKKIQIQLLCFSMIFALVASVSTNAKANEEEKEKKGQLEVIVERTLFLSVSDEELKNSKITKKQMGDVGWIPVEGGFKRYYANTEGTLELNNVTYDIKNGKYLGELKKIEKNGVFTIKFTDNHSKQTYEKKVKIEKFKDNKVYFEISTNFTDFMEDMDNQPTQEEISTESEHQNEDIGINTIGDGDEVRYRNGVYGEHKISPGVYRYDINAYVTCNRFNGYKGDQLYYDKNYSNSHKIYAAFNFAHSDCDRAMAYYNAPCPMNSSGGGTRYCANYMTDKYNSAKCSYGTGLGHSPLYHPHTTSSGPAGN